MKIAAIIAAAGLGKRMGANVPKQYLEVFGRPIICHTLDRFAEASFIDEVIIVVEPERVTSFKQEILDRYAYPKNWKVVAGGSVRQESVSNGVRAIESNPDVVFVHDGVRPFVTIDKMKELGEFVLKNKAAILASPVKETVKRVGKNNEIETTVDRETLWTAETPQAFTFDVMKRAIEAAEKDKFIGTDEASLVERIGVKVFVVKSDGRNIKITTPADIKIAEAILQSKG